MRAVVTYSVICLLVSFLLGSIPWGVIISRLFYRKDIRDYESGNIGTANAFRTMGAVGGVAVFALDFLKGLLAGGLALLLAAVAAYDTSSAVFQATVAGEPVLLFGIEVASAEGLVALNTHVFGLVQGLGVLGCVSGHIFTPWLRFKGGKGVAAAAGSLFFTFGWLGWAVLVGLFAALVLLTRYVSAGSIAAAALAPFAAFWVSQGEPVFTVLIVAVALLVIWAHRENIGRLRAGNERRIFARKADEG